MILAKRLKEYREQEEINQDELAKRLGTSQATVSRLEAGAVAPSRSTIQSISSLLSVTESTVAAWAYQAA